MKRNELRTQLLIAVAGVIAIIFFLIGQQIGYQEYGHNAVVAEVTNKIAMGYAQNAPCIVEFTDANGRNFVYKNADADINIGEIYILTLKDTQGTDEIFDDKITAIRYQSNVSITQLSAERNTR